MRGRSRGFTLIEIVLVAGLAGIIAAAALAPLVYTVRSLGEAQSSFKAENAKRYAVRTIFSDMRGAAANVKFPPVKIRRGQGLSSTGSSLVIWTAATSAEAGSPALVVYGTLRGADGEGTLFRWVVRDAPGRPNGELPIMELDISELPEEEGKKVAGGLKDVIFSARKAGNWQKDYEGYVPEALKVELVRNNGTELYEEWFPNS